MATRHAFSATLVGSISTPISRKIGWNRNDVLRRFDEAVGHEAVQSDDAALGDTAALRKSQTRPPRTAGIHTDGEPWR